MGRYTVVPVQRGRERDAGRATKHDAATVAIYLEDIHTVAVGNRCDGEVACMTRQHPFDQCASCSKVNPSTRLCGNRRTKRNQRKEDDGECTHAPKVLGARDDASAVIYIPHVGGNGNSSATCDHVAIGWCLLHRRSFIR